jgi:DNA invertase Pin-like site-specific DNA recombinase
MTTKKTKKDESDLEDLDEDLSEDEEVKEIKKNIGSTTKSTKKSNKKKTKSNSNNGDVIEEVENILESQIVNDVKYYRIKWLGKKTTTWITKEDFIEKDALREFIQYEKNRRDETLSRRSYIYCRTSKRNNDTEISLKDQERCCIDFAKKNNINIIGIFRDNGVSARDIKNQFSLNYIISHLKKGECILFYDVTRFSRSMFQAIDKLEHIRNNIGATVYAVHDGISWNNIATNRHNFRQLLSASQLHSEVISEKINSSLDYRRQRGDHIGNVPYGYKTEMIDGVRRMIKNPQEIAVIKKIFDLATDLCADNFGDFNLKDDKKGKKSDSKKSAAPLTKKSQRYIAPAPAGKPATKKSVNEQVKTGTKKDMRKNISTNFKIADYKKIARKISQSYLNRQEKPFTWTFVRNIIQKWKFKV